MRAKFLFGLVLIALFSLQSILSAAYIAVVDAGSSGSRMNLFDITKKDGAVQFNAIPLQNNKDASAVSHYVQNPDKIAELIAPLIESLKRGLPSGVNERDVRLYFLSTAGMRTVNPIQQKLLYKNLETYLKSKTSFKVEYVGTISGKMEGVFDWIALNCLEKKLGASDTYGVIDMGGASVQVAYADSSSSEDTLNVRIGSRSYLVNSHSYLGIGANQMRSQFTANANCFPKGLELSDVTGNGNYDKCLSDLHPILAQIHKVETIPPSILVNTKFIGIDNFYRITNSTPFNLGEEVSANDIRIKGKEFAMMTWQEMEAKWPNTPNLYSQYICSAFLVNFIEELGFGPNTKLKTFSRIDGVEVSWALGAAVYYAEGNLPDKGHDPKADIEKLFAQWNASLQTRSPEKVADNYAEDAILISTLSNKVRHNHEEIEDYFEHFLAKQPVVSIDEENIRVFEDIAINSGLYTFDILVDGKHEKIKARYTFVYRKVDGKWLIVEHHSSMLPEKAN